MASNGVIEIKTRTGVVSSRSDEIVRLRFGVSSKRGALLLEYEVPSRGLRAHHSIPVHFGETRKGYPSGKIGDDDVAITAKLKHDHERWLCTVPSMQIVHLVSRLRALVATV